MKTLSGHNVVCNFSGKICYTEREAGTVINSCKRHYFIGWMHTVKNGRTKDVPRRKYLCTNCGFYHLTSNG